MRCVACGHELVAGERFCQSCGRPVAAESSSSPAPESVPNAPSVPRGTAASDVHGPALGDLAAQVAKLTRWRELTWAALAMVLYALIAEAAVETFIRGSPLRWWIVGAAGAYLALCLAAWRLAPERWQRAGWATRAGISLIVVIGAVGVTAWLPGGMTHGVSVLGAQTSTVFAVVSALAIALAGIVIGRNRSLPVAARAIGELLAVYGLVAIVWGVVVGTSYPALFHGASQWRWLPFWLQGAVVGSLFVVPVALVLDIVTGFSSKATTKHSHVFARVAALGMSLVVALAALRSGTGVADEAVEVADASGASGPASGSSTTVSKATPADSAGYQHMSEKVGQLNAAVDVLDGKLDRSLFEINALADKLGSDPTTIFHFVRDQIRYEPYVGVLRGALGTLVCRAGNSLDRSLLLAALLQKSGLAVQIANGELSDADARTLVQRLFEPATPTPSALPADADWMPDLAQALSVDERQLRQSIEQDSARSAVEAGSVLAYTDSEAELVGNLLSRAGVDPAVLTPANRLIAEASNHYWVRYQDASGKWIDLDPAFTNAEPGQARTAAAATFGPDALPEELYHHLRVTLSLRVTTGTQPDSSSDQPLIDQELRVADLQGKAVTVMSLPVPRLDPLKSGVTLMEILDAAKAYQTSLIVGDDRTMGKAFDLKGHIAGIMTPEGVDVEQAGGVGNANGGLLGGIAGASSGDTSKTSTGEGRIVGEWVDYTLTLPAQKGAGVEEHRYHRDIIAPVTVTSWSARNPDKPQVTPTHVPDKALRRRLMWSAELLPVSGATVPSYAGYLRLGALKTARPMLDAFARRANGLPADPATFSKQSTASIRDLLLADASMYFPGGSSPTVRSYFARPGLIAYEGRITDADNAVFTQGYDIVAFTPRTVANATASASDARLQATKIELQRGILATRLEWSLMASRAPKSRSVTNTTAILAAAQNQGVPLRVLRSGMAGVNDVTNLSVPDSLKAELAGELAAGGTVIVPAREVTIDGRSQIGWWRWGTSGDLIGIMPGGRGQSMTEYAVAVTDEALHQAIDEVNVILSYENDFGIIYVDTGTQFTYAEGTTQEVEHLMDLIRSSGQLYRFMVHFA